MLNWRTIWAEGLKNEDNTQVERPHQAHVAVYRFLWATVSLWGVEYLMHLYAGHKIKTSPVFQLKEMKSLIVKL